jgi:hypothetical protein
MKQPYLLKKRGKCWYYRLAEEATFHSTGKMTKGSAELFALDVIKRNKSRVTSAEDLSLKHFAAPYARSSVQSEPAGVTRISTTCCGSHPLLNRRRKAWVDN